MISPTMNRDCESIEEILNYENKWFVKISKHHVILNKNLRALINDIENTEIHLSLIKENVSKQYRSMLFFINNNKVFTKDLTMLSDELDCLQVEQPTLMSSEKKLRQIVLEKQNETIKQQIKELNEQKNFYKLALENLETDTMYVVSKNILNDNKIYNKYVNKNKAEEHFSKINKKIDKTIKEKLTSDRNEIEKRKKIIDRLQKQQSDLQKLLENYTKKSFSLENHYKDKVVNLQNAIKCADTNIKALKRRRLLDAEGFLSDVDILCEKTLKIQRHIKEPDFKKQSERALRDIRTLLLETKGKIIDMYKI